MHRSLTHVALITANCRFLTAELWHFTGLQLVSHCLSYLWSVENAIPWQMLSWVITASLNMYLTSYDHYKISSVHAWMHKNCNSMGIVLRCEQPSLFQMWTNKLCPGLVYVCDRHSFTPVAWPRFGYFNTSVVADTHKLCAISWLGLCHAN